MRYKIYLLSVLILLSMVIDTKAQNNYLKIGTKIHPDKAELVVTGLSFASETPINKSKPKTNGNRFLLINLEVIKIEKGVELSSVNFALTDKSSKKYISPSAWGQIEIFGKLSNYEATDGAKVNVREAGDKLNLIFELPDGLLPDELRLSYDF